MCSPSRFRLEFGISKQTYSSGWFSDIEEESWLHNFCAVALDSGELAYLSTEARKSFRAIEKEFGVPEFGKMIITASNDINEDTLDALNKQRARRQSL